MPRAPKKPPMLVCPNPTCGKRVNICAAQFANGEPTGDLYIGFHSHAIGGFHVECPYSGRPLRP